MKKFNQARVNGGSNYDSTIKRVKRRAQTRSASGPLLPQAVAGLGGDGGCDTVKLRGPPKASATAVPPKGAGRSTRVMTSGVVTAQGMHQWTIRSQTLRRGGTPSPDTGAVQRLDGGGFAPPSRGAPGLRYSLMIRRKACIRESALKVAKCLVI